LIDPNEAAIRSAPKDEQGLMIAASHAWILAFDNLTSIPEWLSDAICRLATGGGFSARELYTDDEEVLFNAQRAVVINGIKDLVTRPDLLDRTIGIDLPPISDQNRIPEQELWENFAECAPGVVATLLDAIVRALADIGTVDIGELPRMADFCQWVEAAAPALGWQPGEFHRIYTGNRAQATATTLEASPIARHILALRDWALENWTGTATELLAELEQRGTLDEKRRSGWPSGPRGMGNALRQLAPALRSAGVEVVFTRDTATRTRDRIIELKSVEPSQPALFNVRKEERPQ
jgi:hypothetical protein